MARSSECTEQYAQKVFDSAGIVREAIFRQRFSDKWLGPITWSNGVPITHVSLDRWGRTDRARV